MVPQAWIYRPGLSRRLVAVNPSLPLQPPVLHPCAPRLGVHCTSAASPCSSHLRALAQTVPCAGHAPPFLLWSHPYLSLKTAQACHLQETTTLRHLLWTLRPSPGPARGRRGPVVEQLGPHLPPQMWCPLLSSQPYLWVGYLCSQNLPYRCKWE